MIDLARLRTAHAAALQGTVTGADHRLPVPTSHEVLAELHRMGVATDRWTTIAACVAEGLSLTDAPAPGECCPTCGGVRALLERTR